MRKALSYRTLRNMRQPSSDELERREEYEKVVAVTDSDFKEALSTMQHNKVGAAGIVNRIAEKYGLGS